VLICILVAVFVRNRILLKHITAPLPPQKINATLSIQNFRHTATQDGQRKWSVEATSANLYSKENTAELSNISATFFLSNDKIINLTADKGVLNVDTNNLSVSGHIVIKFDDYVLTTEHLNYFHKSHMINSSTPVEITGNTMILKAKALSYDLDTDIIKCSGGVSSVFKQFNLGE
jgi:LPS export ABC transporter protein LptC